MIDTIASGAILRAAEPQLFVTDISRACDFYLTQLGFALAFQHGEPPFYAQVWRGGARLNLRLLDTPAFDPQRREREQLLSASIVLDDATALYHEYQAAGVTFAQALQRQSWGALTFVVNDPDGNLILFAGSAALAAGGQGVDP